ncbi:hypothetical protein BX600DRAFT_489765 [Xylariales sp. PMI_506]|nr:hypothetical protein BX600DRAFT_489765 [Xylariales sp. PMI_506]
MVKIAVAGGSGQVSREVIDALVSSNKHEITILSRNERTSPDIIPGLQWQVVDYGSKESLMEALRGIHTVLSFVQTLSDPDQQSQKNLIDAAISAGVKRFAPSEYGSKDTINMPWSHPKQVIRDYLKEVNKNEEVIEYTLFQPGLFLDYLAYPYKTSKYMDPLQSVFDFQNRRAIVVEGHEDAIMTLTTLADLAAIVVRAVDHEGRWPIIGGISGSRLTFSEILEIGNKVRGYPFTVEKVNVQDLEAGNLKASWHLQAKHKSISDDQASAMLRVVTVGILLSSSNGAWNSSDEFNLIFPEYEFTSAEEFLTGVWKEKP